jgi:hypothetical protein
MTMVHLIVCSTYYSDLLAAGISSEGMTFVLVIFAIIALVCVAIMIIGGAGLFSIVAAYVYLKDLFGKSFNYIRTGKWESPETTSTIDMFPIATVDEAGGIKRVLGLWAKFPVNVKYECLVRADLGCLTDELMKSLSGPTRIVDNTRIKFGQDGVVKGGAFIMFGQELAPNEHDLTTHSLPNFEFRPLPEIEEKGLVPSGFRVLMAKTREEGRP